MADHELPSSGAGTDLPLQREVCVPTPDRLPIQQPLSGGEQLDGGQGLASKSLSLSEFVELARNWKPTPEQVAAHFKRAQEASDKFEAEELKRQRDANDPAFLNRTYSI